MEREAGIFKRAMLYDWQRRLMILLVGIFLLQFVEWIAKEKDLWLWETISIVRWTIVVTFVLELIPRLHWTLRGVLQLAALVAVNAKVLHQNGIIPKLTLQSFFTSKVVDNLSLLAPYLWFALGAWVVYLALIWWVEAKWRIYTLILVSILIVSVRDSFSTIYLWQQVAVMLFCGLFLVIISHFQQLKQKDPSAYGYLSEYPTSIAFPVVSLISLTVLIGALMPEINPLVTDPYTAWRNLRGQPASFTTGKGIEVTPLASDTSSGYSRTDQALGGGFNYDYTPVFTVDTTHRSYWRGETRSLYTGRGWEQSEGDKRAAQTPVRADTLLPGDSRQAGSQLETVEVKQTVTIMTDQTYPVLFGSLFMQKIEEADGGKSGMDRFNWAAQQGELRFNEQLNKPYPKTYTIISQMPVIDETGLRQVPLDPPNKAQLADYLQVPERLPERVKQLAADITKDAANPFDKAKKLEEYLRLNYPYTNKPDVTKGRSRDFVDRFLFDIREGYCDYYSTAMAVMLRTVGVPTRWVKGYASGQLPIDDTMMELDPSLTDPDMGGLYTVRNADAHSWVEVYFSGWGWIPFEPTSGFVLPLAVPQPELVVDTTTVPTVEDTGVTSMIPSKENMIGIGAVIVGLALFVFGAMRFDLIELVQERMKERRAHLFKQKVIVECEKLLRIFRRKGYNRFEHETLREAIHRWTADSKWLKPELDLMLALFEKAKYSKYDVTEEDWQSALRTVQKLRSQL